MKDIYRVLRRPIVTEKSTIQRDESNKVTFEVDRRANKIEIKQAVQQLFNVKVSDVHLMNCNGKKKRVGRYMGKTADWKKAVVTLNEGEEIEFFDGV
ncbi:MAG: 50S ribosomal protein L23 [Deltaproteobacteria bacterium]|nr:50S ribosomal protein L23 [Deltaproteobacteria bacterium]